ncbi:MAG: ATP-binding cassette domain-containing protein [Desulfovibrionaceae bacterium]|nr:ATP-binding cassette domain-containing protein [Desulfovibrionaceae bacterium]
MFRTSWDIKLENVQAGYGERIVLHDIDAVIPAGKITVVLGESGCGKSTLLRHIIGLSRPVGGRIFHGGNDLFALPESEFRKIRRRFGVLFQDGALLGSLSLAENVGLPLTEHTSLPAPIIRKAVLRTLRLVGLEKFADYYPNELSGGMKKRGGLARAIITEPPVLFCDEPTSGLDPINASLMDRLLLKMHRQYPFMTIVSVSHDMSSVSSIADCVMLIRDGKIAFSGTRDAFYADSSPYLRSFRQRLSEESPAMDAEPVDPAVRCALDTWITQ